MKVRELIEQLQAVGPDLPVVCNNFPDRVYSIVVARETNASIELNRDGTPYLEFGNLPGDHDFNTAKVMIVISNEIDPDF